MQRLRGLGLRLTIENLTDEPYLFKQGDQDQRRYELGRAVMFSVGYSFF
jgi:outer membrane receptor protein involved in Fe transport